MHERRERPLWFVLDLDAFEPLEGDLREWFDSFACSPGERRDEPVTLAVR